MLTRSLKIGIVCPYGWDTPGGVQNHVRDLAEYLIAAGHDISVLAPVIDENKIPDYVTSAGKPIAIPYNGAVARILFGPIAFARVRQWIAQGDFDILHLHEPAIPSISLLACWAGEGPMVGTFHAAAKRQKAIFAIGPILEPVIEKLSARIAVSEAARETLTEHLETDAVVIPNGIYADLYRDGVPQEQWQKNTLGFIGRFEEPRKGLSVLVDALPIISRFAPDVRVFVAGPGDSKDVIESIDPQLSSRFTFLGKISEQDKANFLASISLYIAPNTGGESFGIILAEAMSCRTPIVASNLPAFQALLDGGKSGALFENEDSADLARQIVKLLDADTDRSAVAQAGYEKAMTFDWDVVGSQILSVYEMALAGNNGVILASENRFWNRLRSND